MALLFERQLDDSKDKFVLLVCFFIGLGTIVLFRGFIGKGGISITDLVATLIVVGIIIVYTLYIITTKYRTGNSYDRASDNAYYLGLLFTLVSLSTSLIKILSSSSESDIIVSSAALLPDFGLALFSTIAGILARVYIQQLRPDIDDVETDSIEKLNALTQVLQGSIQSIVGNIDGLSKQISISMSDMATGTGEVMTKITNDVTAVITASTDQNRELLSGVSKTVKDLGDQSAAQLENLVINSRGISDSMSHLNQSLDHYKTLNSAISDSVAEQKNYTDSVSAASIAAESLFSKVHTSDLIQGVDNAVKQYSELGSEIKNTAQGFDSINLTLQSTAQNIEGINQSLQTRGAQIDAITKTADAAATEYINALTDASSFLRGKSR